MSACVVFVEISQIYEITVVKVIGSRLVRIAEDQTAAGPDDSISVRKELDPNALDIEVPEPLLLAVVGVVIGGTIFIVVALIIGLIYYPQSFIFFPFFFLLSLARSNIFTLKSDSSFVFSLKPMLDVRKVHDNLAATFLRQSETEAKDDHDAEDEVNEGDPEVLFVLLVYQIFLHFLFSLGQVKALPVVPLGVPVARGLVVDLLGTKQTGCQLQLQKLNLVDVHF